ncbi:type I restriction enzyme S subunit [Micromonospora echinospora]|uniref:Type I restriction enzyme S subunit n=1 Tax=Micromonospora echinospora TaxID=1877 RepID=A0ABR6M997_MICEC|nr:restriction endonuclease subunit S [Micromonospora echinospora]MBB5111953.1 type I restriction enzyme S subunit [Micromonospora echinospora]
MSDASLPEGWAKTTLAALGVEAGPGFASGRHNRDGQGVLHLRPMNINRHGALDLTDVRYVADDSDRRVQSGDILFNNTNSPALVGKTTLVQIKQPVGYSNHMTRLRPPDGIVPGFLASQLHWLWMSGYFQKVLNNHVNQASVATNKLLETVIAVPPTPEQHRIVETLDDYLSRLDAVMKVAASAQRRLKPFTASVLDRTVLGTLTIRAASDSSDDSRHFLEAFESKRFDYGALPSLPKGWFWRRSSDVCEFICSGSTPAAPLMHAGSGDIPFLKVYNITQDGRVDFTNKPTYVDRETHEKLLKRSRVRPGDVLTNIVGPPLGKTAIVPDHYPEWNINQAIVAFRAGPEVDPDWLALALRSPFVLGMLKKTAKATAGQFNVALSTCREVPLPIPPMDEQRALVAQSAQLLEASDRLNSQMALISVRSQHLRQAILRRAFAGKLVHQDPHDEPASVLLDRSRAEHEAKGGKAANSTRRPGRTAAVKATPLPPRRPSTPGPINAVQQELPL